jgi:pimeloyl-ACP methyl ester carboxylesterase
MSRVLRHPAGAGKDIEMPQPAQTTESFTTHVFGATLLPSFLMSWFYKGRAERLAQGGAVHYHAMPNGGLGRTDAIVESFVPILEDARQQGEKLRLVGHSLGGVVAWALAHEVTEAVDTVEVWGAPLRGTGLANFFKFIQPVQEATYLARGSEFLKGYDRPLNGPVVRSLYTALDLFVVPPRESCFVEGDRAENHLLSPRTLARSEQRASELVHPGLADHVLLPRHGRLLEAIAA